MAQINKPTDYFNTLTYTGTGSSSTKTGVGFQPDLTWVKARGNTTWHYLYDAVRTAGIEKELHSNSTAAEGASDGAAYGYLSAFTSDGFSTVIGSNASSDALNKSGTDFVAWNWKASGSTASNTDGDVTSTVSVNTTAGFSIVKWTGTGFGSIGVGHGLGVTPKVVILKNLNGTLIDWHLYNTVIDNSLDILYLNTAGTKADSSASLPTSSVFNTISVTNNANDYIAYCFAEKKGYSKFGSYTGNGNTDGTFIYTGFKPAFVIIKNTDLSTENWTIYDNKRRTFNPNNTFLYPNLNNSEVVNDTYPIDLLSNGFKARNSNDQWNGSGHSYIYMAFAENPIVGSNNIPAVAR